MIHFASRYRGEKYTWKPFDEYGHRTVPTLEEIGITSFHKFQKEYFSSYHSLPAKHQIDWGIMIDTRSEKYLGFNEPRYAGKSITFSTEYPIWEFLRDYNSAGLLITASDYLAKSYTRAIVDAMLTNEELHQDFKTRWWLDMKKAREGYSAHEIFLKRTIMGREPSFMTAGIGKQIIGFHPWYIIADDIIQTAMDRTGLRGENLEEWINKVLIPMDPQRFLMVGTRKAPNDIYAYMQKLGIFWWSTRPALKYIPEYEVYFDENDRKQIRITDSRILEDPKEAIRIVYWPERYTLEALLLLRETIGHEAFSGEFQNDPVPSEGLIFKREWLQYFLLNDFYTTNDFKYGSLYTAVDIGGASEWADYNAIVTILKTPTQIYVVDIKFGHWRVPELLKHVRETYYQWADWHKYPLKIGIEASFLQTAVYDFINILSLETLPLMELRPTEKKELRIDSLTTYYLRRLIWMTEDTPGYIEFIREYLSYDPEKSRKHQIKNDVLDAEQQAIQIALEAQHGMGGVRQD